MQSLRQIKAPEAWPLRERFILRTQPNRSQPLKIRRKRPRLNSAAERKWTKTSKRPNKQKCQNRGYRQAKGDLDPPSVFRSQGDFTTDERNEVSGQALPHFKECRRANSSKTIQSGENRCEVTPNRQPFNVRRQTPLLGGLILRQCTEWTWSASLSTPQAVRRNRLRSKKDQNPGDCWACDVFLASISCFTCCLSASSRLDRKTSLRSTSKDPHCFSLLRTRTCGGYSERV